MGTAKLVKQNLGALDLAQIAPVRHLDEEPEAISKSWVQRLSPEILFLVAIVTIGGRIHRRPAIAQLFEFHSLHTPLMDDREELVLQIGPRAVEFIHEDDLCVPDCRRRGDVAQRGLGLVRQRDAHQVVVVNERRVVEPVDKAKRLCQPLKQKTLGRAVFSDQEERLPRCQSRQQHRFQPLPAEQTERARQKGTDVAPFEYCTGGGLAVRQT